MCSPEEEGLQLCCALLRSFCSQFSEGWPSSGPHAGAQGSCVRARSGACCGVSCAAGLLAPLPAIFWPGCGRCGYACRWPLEPAPLRCGIPRTLPAQASFHRYPPAGCGEPLEQGLAMGSWQLTAAFLRFKNLQGHLLLTFSACCGAGIWSQSLSFHSYDFDRG